MTTSSAGEVSMFSVPSTTVCAPSEMNKLLVETEANYENLLFKEALRTGFFSMQGARDKYRELCGEAGMSRPLVLQFIEWQAILFSPLCPHVAEHLWHLLGKEGSILRSSWPKVWLLLLPENSSNPPGRPCGHHRHPAVGLPDGGSQGLPPEADSSQGSPQGQGEGSCPAPCPAHPLHGLCGQVLPSMAVRGRHLSTCSFYVTCPGAGLSEGDVSGEQGQSSG